MGPIFWLSPNFRVFTHVAKTPKIAKFVKNGPIFQENSQRAVHYFYAVEYGVGHDFFDELKGGHNLFDELKAWGVTFCPFISKSDFSVLNHVFFFSQ